MYSYRMSKSGNLTLFYLRKMYKKARYKKAETRAWKSMTREMEAGNGQKDEP